MSVSPKLFLFTAFGLALIAVLAYQWRAGARRVAFAMLIVPVVCWVVSPWVYRFWPGGPFARPTISWPEVLLLFSMVYFFTPAKGRELTQFQQDGFDAAIPTGPAPLSEDSSPPRYH